MASMSSYLRPCQIPRILIGSCVPVVLSCATSAHGPGFWARRGTIATYQFSASGRLLAVGGRDVGTEAFDDHGDVKLYRADQPGVLHQIMLPHRVGYLTFDPAERFLAIRMRTDREYPYRWGFAVYRLSETNPPWPVFNANGSPYAEGLRFSPDSRFLAAYGGAELKVWETCTWQLKLSVTKKVAAVSFSAHGGLLAVADRDTMRPTAVFDLAQGSKTTEITATAPPLRDPSGRWWIAFDPKRSAIVFWDIERSTEDFVLNTPGDKCVAIAVSRDGRLAAIIRRQQGAPEHATESTELHIWETTAQDLARPVIRRIPGDVVRLDFLDDSATLLIDGRRPRLVDIGSGEIKGLPSAMRGHIAMGREKLASSAVGEAISVWQVKGLETRLLWQDRWRRHSWSWLE